MRCLRTVSRGRDGDFANTDFSSNDQDLLAAANTLANEYGAPELLIGQSLGGAAVLAAAPQLGSVKAVATIGAPATAGHVEHLLAEVDQELQSGGSADRRPKFPDHTAVPGRPGPIL